MVKLENLMRRQNPRLSRVLINEWILLMRPVPLSQTTHHYHAYRFASLVLLTFDRYG